MYSLPSSSSPSRISAFERKKCIFPAVPFEVSCSKYPTVNMCPVTNTNFQITYRQLSLITEVFLTGFQARGSPGPRRRQKH